MSRMLFVLAASALMTPCSAAAQKVGSDVPVPPRVIQARRFLAQRSGQNRSAIAGSQPRAAIVTPHAADSSTAIWQPLGPTAVMTPHFGLVTGRVSSIAIDPSDSTGNRVLIGTTGGGVWASQNAGASSSVLFSPLTDTPAALNDVRAASISIGAITIQPGGTGVILAGTGDPNDALDSYYGTGVLRSADNGNSWTLISSTTDRLFSFQGEGFAGFAWSTSKPQLVVAAVAQAYEGALVDATIPYTSSAGLYYSTDAGASWSLATITDTPGQNVQGPNDQFPNPNGNSATSVVWNAMRGIFIAAVRFHGYYQSTDGVTWTRMANQPGAGLTPQTCPTNTGLLGSPACPIFRGALAVNPATGDTFAWTVDLYNQDLGIWQDVCAVSANACSNQTVAFSRRWNTALLESSTAQGPLTIANGDYNLVLAAVPSQQDTSLLAGANDLWKCSLAMGCVWRNTTNANSCMSAAVGPYQHALEWNPANPQEIFIGNDSGLWRSMDAIGQTGSVCSSTDASHFQNLNSGLGSLAEIESMSQIVDTPYTILAGLGANGSAGVKSTAGTTADWPQVFGGEGGPVAVDPVEPVNWYVNSGAGVSIFRCSQSAPCSASDFGSTPVVGNADVSGDGYGMTAPAPFIVDPVDHTQLLVGTCRVWRVGVAGPGTSANVISPMLDGVKGQPYCSGDALIRSIAALPIAGGREVIYVGMYGAATEGGIVGGHVLKAIYDPASSSIPAWQDLALNPVQNENLAFNANGYDISSIYIDPHDPTGNTAYATVGAMQNFLYAVRILYRTTDGGAHWTDITSNLPMSTANSVAVDPQDSGTVYVATDMGVYATRSVANCSIARSNCWSTFGAGLPYSPVVQLSAAPAGTSPEVLVAGTYGRGIWQVPLWTAGTQLTTASAQPASLSFSSQIVGTRSAAQTITVTNRGGVALNIDSITVTGDFSETDTCVNATVSASSTCLIQVRFAPSRTGSISGQIVITGNIEGGSIVIALSGEGASQGPVATSPGELDFGQVQLGKTSTALSITVENTSGSSIPVTSVDVTSPFQLAGSSCGSSLLPNSDCQLSVTFTPAQAGAASGTLTLTDGVGTQAVTLSGMGMTVPTDSISPASLTFPVTAVGQLSSAQVVTLTNDGDLPLLSINVSASAGFQESSNCGPTLSGHTSCPISVVFAPATVGNISGSLTISDSIRTQTVALSGTGVTPALLAVTPAQVSFPAQLIGTTAAAIPVTISNKGGAALAGLSFQLSGEAPSNFAWNAGGCGSTLNPGEACTVQLTFTPGTAGQLNAVFVVSSSTRGVNAVQVSLSGVGQAASGISIAPATMSFSQPVLGQPSAPQTATITNTGSSIATGLALSTAPPFSISQNTCGSSLAPGASCTANILFTPTANGTVSGALTVASSAFSSAATLALAGIGGAAGSLSIQPSTLTFSTTGVGTTSATETVIFTNDGAVALNSLAISASGGFQVASTTCGSALEIGASCEARIAFVPTTAGQQSGTVTVSSASLASARQMTLSGMGADFAIAVSGQSSQSIASGQAANYTVTLTPINGSSGTFTFACTALPANSACSFNPPSETVGANTTGTVAVKIATGISAASAFNTQKLARILPAICALFAAPLAYKRRRRVLMLVALLVASTFAITSCAGAGGGGGGVPGSGSSNNNTPAGTYSAVVAATANGVTHKLTVSLTVD